MENKDFDVIEEGLYDEISVELFDVVDEFADVKETVKEPLHETVVEQANVPDEKQMGRVEAIIYSMTPAERANPSVLNPSRKNRIAKGAGVDIAEVNRLVKQFEQSRKMMKQMGGMMKGKRGGGMFGKMKFPF